ncbi:MAG: hypothetical protein JXB32_22595 [Deltaproteobacteria bacterium]|nr:hypothetical protein [Deltaproteobacteria bacterium]
MKKHLMWIPVVALLAAASAFAAWSSTPAPDEGTSAAAVHGLACPGGGHGGCGNCRHAAEDGQECNCGGGCNCGEGGECNCGPECPRFVDENGDTVCDDRGQGNCGCHHGGE